MRTSVITRFAKNDRAFSGRRRIATLAAATVLAGGVQFLATDSAWACGGPDNAAVADQSGPAAGDQGDVRTGISAGFHMTPPGQTITPGGPKLEIGDSVGNFTGATVQNASPLLAIYNPRGGLRPQDFVVEVSSDQGWKTVPLRHGCDPTLWADAPSAKADRLETGRVANFMYRVRLSAQAPKDLTELQVTVGGRAKGFPVETSEARTVRVVRQAENPAPAPKPTTTAKPTTPAKPAPAKQDKPAPAKPAADQTSAPAATKAPAAAPTKAPAAPSATPSAAPATTAPAGTPELAQTGSSSSNTFLLAASAALLALGAGVLIAVRRLRPQR
ncbi:LPXTG-motif cell wall-anchored protein [Kitasatospora sp. MAA19]|uniref:LPXTG cell wall anchor domain-containing protein n=1 Tax=unclassified Kitasatospora TaxID=2633591 RepID=UPI0024747DCA|nr:LPXTG cell wall anchor domain-containing protein [Kitasatospora sp. MAA19]MDH6703621.1 LPXTG-motif cell wall-anchored protein [Kitasatospora sp. MAA19]